MQDNQNILKIAEILQAYAAHCHKNPEIRRSDGIIHVSDVARETGWNCDRYIEYIRVGEPRINPTSTIPEVVWPVLWVGQGIEGMLDQVLGKALETILPQRGMELLDFQLQASFEDEERGFVGHADYVIVWRGVDGEVYTQVVDAKSTSPARDAKRAVGSKGLPVSKTDLEHVRQVAIYRHYLGLDYGSVFYVTKSGVPRLSDGAVDGTKVVPVLQRRLDRIAEELASGRRLVPTRGSYCADCQWSTLCQNDGEPNESDPRPTPTPAGTY